MNKQDAKKLAETITNEQLHQMFLNAQSNITDWEHASKINKGLSVGVAFNILTAGGFGRPIHNIAKTNMLREFGDYLDDAPTTKAKKEKENIKASHQPPIFIK